MNTEQNSRDLRAVPVTEILTSKGRALKLVRPRYGAGVRGGVGPPGA